MACRMSSSATRASAISPLRTPRERACPNPTILSPPSATSSHTPPQTLQVPVSKQTMMEEGSNMFSSGVSQRLGRFGCRGRDSAGFQPTCRNVVGNRQVQGRDYFVLLLASVEDFPPAQQLSFEVVRSKGDF